MFGAALRWLFGSRLPPAEPDGFGQSAGDDLRFVCRFQRCRRTATAWRLPYAAEARAHDADPILGRFGDITIGVADVDGRRWIVRERDWHGWPDPPRYVFFAVADETVWAAADFDRWPTPWQPPPAPMPALPGA